MDAKLKHLEFIQSVINRMGAQSFRLKSSSVVLISALMILGAREDSGEAAFVGLVPVVVFWWLDAYFLHQERLFRALYDRVRMLNAKQIDFSMNTKSLDGPKLSLASALLSKKLLAFYFAIAVGVSVAGLIVSSRDVVGA